MKIKTIDFILPAYLAGYLINGDIDNLSENELDEVDHFLNINKLESCVNVSSEPFFKWSNDFNNLGGDCLTYDFIPF